MPGEFQGPSKHERSRLYSLKSSTIRGFAEHTENQTLLEKFLHIMAERALAEEFNMEADEAAIFIHQKLEALRQQDREFTIRNETEMQRLAQVDSDEAKKFFEVFPYYFQDDDPQLAELEQRNESLFKQQ